MNPISSDAGNQGRLGVSGGEMTRVIDPFGLVNERVRNTEYR